MLQSLTDGLEESWLDRTAGEALAEIAVAVAIDRDEPARR